MAIDLQQAKIGKLFSQLDANGNGYIEESDVSAIAQRVLAGLGESESAPKGRELVRSYMSIWTKLVEGMDLNADGRILPEEYKQGIAKTFLEPEGAYDRYFHPAVVATWELLDTNGDGTVSRSEFDTFQRAFGTPPEELDEIFAKVDSDGSGVLDKAEMIEHGRDFYTSTDENATGNWLFGRLS